MLGIDGMGANIQVALCLLRSVDVAGMGVFLCKYILVMEMQ